MKKIKIFMVALVALSLFISGCGSKNSEVDSWGELEKRGKIIVGLDDTFVPMGFKDNSGTLTGFDVDMAKEAGERLGMEIEFQPVDWNLKEQELDTGNIDLIWNGYSITEERLEKVNFTKPYLDNKQIIVVLSGSSIETREDLEDKIVATQNSSSSLEAIEKSGEKESFKNGEVILFDTYNDAFMDLEVGRVEVVVADSVLARYYIAERGAEKFRIPQGDFGDEEYGVGLRLGDKILLEKLNKALDEMKADGSAEEISRKWFGENIIK